ncbi:MAG: nicotinamide-nucleotide adenylyltransferase, partial [Nitrososphaerales archaeon]
MKYGLLVGRFQPFHNGHLYAVKFALTKVDMLWIVIGSAQKSHEQRNPFTTGERLAMIKATLDASKVNPKRWLAVPVNDMDIHSLWVSQLDMLVPKYDVVFTNDPFSSLLFKEHGKRVMKIPFLKRDILEGTVIRRRIAND